MAALTLSGCIHKSLIQETTDEFIGQPLSAVTAKLGAPTEEPKLAARGCTSGPLALAPRAVREVARYG
jgi:hypothetical protein